MDSSSAIRARSRFEFGFQTYEAESCRFVRWSFSEAGERRVVVEDSRRDGETRELARDRVRPSETPKQRKQRRAATSRLNWDEYFRELGTPDPWWVAILRDPPPLHELLELAQVIHEATHVRET